MKKKKKKNIKWKEKFNRVKNPLYMLYLLYFFNYNILQLSKFSIFLFIYLFKLQEIF